MSKKKSVDTVVLLVAVIGSLVLLNILGIRLFRKDLTRDGIYTLSRATIDMLQDLKDPVTVRAYITKDLPPPWSATSRYVQDMLDEYFVYADGKFRYEIIDPTSEETEADKEKKKDLKRDMFGRLIREKTSVERELERLGIHSFQAGRMDADTKEMKRAYMGLVIKFGDKTEVIPRVETDPRGLEHARNLEYELTTKIRKATRESLPKIALITGHGNPDLALNRTQPGNSMSMLHQLLQQLYQVTTIDLTDKKEIEDDVDAILVVGPKTPFSEEEQRTIDQFIMSGRSAAFFLGLVSPDIQTMQPNETDHGLTDLLASYGAKIEPGLVLDTESGLITTERRQGNMQIREQKPYPFILLRRRLNPDNPLTRGMVGVVLPFMGSVILDVDEETGVKGEVVVRSSPNSWIHTPPYDLNPNKRWNRGEVGELDQRSLMVTLMGSLPSHFHKMEAAEDVSSEPVRAENARVLVAAGHGFLMDQAMSRSNRALALNLMDWLVMDEALLNVRTRGLTLDLLDKDLSDGTRALVKYLNIVGLPLAFVGIGLVRWRMRESRRKKIRL